MPSRIKRRTSNRQSATVNNAAITWRNDMSRIYTQMREKVHQAPQAGIPPTIITEAALCLAGMGDVLLRFGIQSGVATTVATPAATSMPSPAATTAKISRIPTRSTRRTGTQGKRQRFRLRAAEKAAGLTLEQARNARIAAGEKNVAPLPSTVTGAPRQRAVA